MSDPGASAARWDRLADTFEAALSLRDDERAAFLTRALADDPSARDEVIAMLAAHEGARPLQIEGHVFGADNRTGPGESSLPPGTRVGSYRIDALIREGGMGEVYRGERVDGEYRQTVALKVLRARARSAQLERRFQIERQILARLIHPDITAILDGGATADGRPYLVMPYIEGLPITEYCDRNALTVAARVRLVQRVAEAVQYAHGRLVVHRDLKPSNILVTAAGEPRLLDFGIAKLLAGGDDEIPELSTRAELRLLTPEYAAPEQIHGEPVTTATDVYSLGVLLYELLTGQRPARPARPTLADGPTRPPSSVAAQPATGRRLRGDLDRIVLMALRREPERRYGSAGQLAEDLERHLAGMPVRAQPDTFRYRAGKFVARNRLLVVAGSVVTALLALLAVSATLSARRVARERDRAEGQRLTAESAIGMLTDLVERSNPRIVPGGDTLRVAALLDLGERNVNGLTNQPALQARMWRVLGNMHAARGRYARADSLLRQSYQQQLALPGADVAATARTYHELARVVLWLRGPEAARPILDSSVAGLRRTLGDDHPDVASALLDLAAATTDLEQRRALLDQVVAERRRIGVDSMTIAATLNGVGQERFARGRGAEATALFEGALRLLEQRLPPDHPNRVAVTHNLSAALSLSGNWVAAEPLARRVVEARRRATAPDSIALGNAIENWATIRAYLGDLAEAEPLLREVLAIFRAALPAEHWHITSTLRNLALVIGGRGRAADGLALMDSAVARERARVGDQGENTGYYIGQRVLFLLRLGRAPEAVEAAQTADRILHATTPPGSSRRADAHGWVGAAAFATGNALAASVRFDSARSILAELLPPTDQRRTAVDCGLGVSLAALGRRAEAAPHLWPACGLYEKAGLADPVLVGWGRAAMKANGPSPTTK